MYLVVLQADAAGTQQHIERDKELKQRGQQPEWDHICWPEKEEGVQHIEGANDSNNTPADVRSSLDVKEFVKSALVLLLSQLHHHEIKDAVQEDHDQNECIAIVLGLVNGDDEAEAFHYQ